MGKKPNFLIVGAGKSGTTSLHYYLKQHPEIFMPEKKECKFFSGIRINRGPGDESRNLERIRTWDEYISLFDNAVEQNKAVGEATPDYLYFHETAIELIKKYLGSSVKIIIILRNPTDRAYSAYLHHRRDMVEKLSFEEALKAEDERIEKDYAFLWHYKKAGLYAKAVNHYKEEFEKVLVLLFEDLKYDLNGTLKTICDFLEVNPNFSFDAVVKNKSGEPKFKWLSQLIHSQSLIKKIFQAILPKSFRKKIKNKVKQNNLRKTSIPDDAELLLNSYYRDDIKKLEQILNKNLGHWVK